MYKTQGFPFLEIFVFVHNKIYGWGGVRCVKYATWCRPYEEITEIYNHNIGANYSSQVRLNKNPKKLYVTPCTDNMICDIYVLSFEANSSFNSIKSN